MSQAGHLVIDLYVFKYYIRELFLPTDALLQHLVQDTFLNIPHRRSRD